MILTHCVINGDLLKQYNHSESRQSGAWIDLTLAKAYWNRNLGLKHIMHQHHYILYRPPYSSSGYNALTIDAENDNLVAIIWY